MSARCCDGRYARRRRRSGADGPLAGHGWSGAVPLAGVAVSCDGGARWQEVELAEGEGPFAWRAFTAQIAVEAPGPLSVMARARDAAGNIQPLEPIWNPRGDRNNAVQRVAGTAVLALDRVG